MNSGGVKPLLVLYAAFFKLQVLNNGLVLYKFFKRIAEI